MRLGSKTMQGRCELCGQFRELVDSHVWPKFAYKKFVSDLSKGGVFVDLGKGRMSNLQYTRPWFCKHCDNVVLGRVEGYASAFCTRIQKRPSEPKAYDDRLLRFAASVSWRTTKSDLERYAREVSLRAKAAMDRWRQYVRGRKSSVKPFSQHLFVVFDPIVGWHKSLGGQLFPRQNLVLSQVGPLFIVGLLDRRKMPLADLRIWDQSEILPTGGTVNPVSAWVVGKTVTLDFARLLGRHESATKMKILSMK